MELLLFETSVMKALQNLQWVYLIIMDTKQNKKLKSTNGYV